MIFHKNNSCTVSVGIQKDRYIVSEIKDQPGGIIHYSTEDIDVFKDKEVLMNLGRGYINYLFMRSSLKNRKKAEEEIFTRARSKVEDSDSYDFFTRKTGDTYIIFYTKKELFSKLFPSLELKDIIIYPEVLGPYNYWYHHHHKNKPKNSVIIQMQKRDTIIQFIRGKDLYDIKSIPIGIEHYEEVSKVMKFPDKGSDHMECDSLKSLKKINLRWMREIKHSLSGNYTLDPSATEVFLLGYENSIDNLNILLEGYLKLAVSPSIEKEHSFSNVGLLGNLFALRGEVLRKRKDNRLVNRIIELYNHIKTGTSNTVRSKKTLYRRLRSS